MGLKAFGAAASVTGLAVGICALAVVVELPRPAEAVMIAGALLLLACAGVLTALRITVGGLLPMQPPPRRED
jgi:hypothetical protein